MNKLVIGIAGFKGSGKNTVASIIREEHPGVEETALAKKLKLVCSEVLGLPLEYTEKQELKEKELDNYIYLSKANVEKILSSFEIIYDYDQHVRPHLGMVIQTPRQLLQYVGTEVLRNFDTSIHCQGVHKFTESNDITLITDVRFLDEAQYFRERYSGNFHLVYVARYSAELDGLKATHASEKEIPQLAKQAIRIENNGSLAELKNQTLEVFNAIYRSYLENNMEAKN